MKTKIFALAVIFALNTYTFATPKVDALFNAIETQNASLVGLLVSEGVNPNQGSSIYNITPLMFAVDNGNIDVVHELIKNGSSVDIADNFGTTPLIQSIKNNRNQIASLLIKNSRNIDKKDNKGVSALHYAAKQGDEGIFRQILQHGGNLKALDSSGNNSLFYAIAGRNKSIINTLIKMRYFDLSHTNDSGENAVKIAQRYGLHDISSRLSRGRN